MVGAGVYIPKEVESTISSIKDSGKIIEAENTIHPKKTLPQWVIDDVMRIWDFRHGEGKFCFEGITKNDLVAMVSGNFHEKTLRSGGTLELYKNMPEPEGYFLIYGLGSGTIEHYFIGHQYKKALRWFGIQEPIKLNKEKESVYIIFLSTKRQQITAAKFFSDHWIGGE